MFCDVLGAYSLVVFFFVVLEMYCKWRRSLGGSEAETNKKPSLNRSAKERRNSLFRVLDGVLSLSHKKIHNGGNSDRLKQGCARVLVSAVSTYGTLLKDEELELRVIALEDKLKNSVLIPKQHDDSKVRKTGRGL